jgi:hypothetical protein
MVDIVHFKEKDCAAVAWLKAVSHTYDCIQS